MGKKTFPGIVAFLSLKYWVFFIILSFMEDRFKDAVVDPAQTNIEFLKLALNYFVYVFIYSLPLIILFSLFLYSIQLPQSKGFLLIGVLLFLMLEFYFYSRFYSPSDLMPGLVNCCVSVLFFSIRYRKIFCCSRHAFQH